MATSRWGLFTETSPAPPSTHPSHFTAAQLDENVPTHHVHVNGFHCVFFFWKRRAMFNLTHVVQSSSWVLSGTAILLQKMKKERRIKEKESAFGWTLAFTSKKKYNSPSHHLFNNLGLTLSKFNWLNEKYIRNLLYFFKTQKTQAVTFSLTFSL